MNDDFSAHYSESSFWEKIKKHGKHIGKDVIEKALVLFYVGNDPKTPAWAKGVVFAALGYLIFPMDAIPDFTPAVGYADDLGALAAASAAVVGSITKEHREQAKKKLDDWFGDLDE